MCQFSGLNYIILEKSYFGEHMKILSNAYAQDWKRKLKITAFLFQLFSLQETLLSDLFTK